MPRESVYPGATNGWTRLSLREWQIPVIAYRCGICSRPITQEFTYSTCKCWSCHGEPQTRPWRKFIQEVWALTAYVREEPRFPSTCVVRRAKKDATLAREMMQLAAQDLKADRSWVDEGWEPDLVVPCPSHPSVSIPRSASMARGVADVLGVPAQDLLNRTDDGPPQASSHGSRPPESETEMLSRMDILASGGDFTGEERVLLVDDVLTHGDTAGISANVLHDAGVKEIRVLVFGRSTSKEHLEAYCD